MILGPLMHTFKLVGLVSAKASGDSSHRSLSSHSLGSINPGRGGGHLSPSLGRPHTNQTPGSLMASLEAKGKENQYQRPHGRQAVVSHLPREAGARKRRPCFPHPSLCPLLRSSTEALKSGLPPKSQNKRQVRWNMTSSKRAHGSVVFTSSFPLPSWFAGTLSHKCISQLPHLPFYHPSMNS